MNSTSKEHEPSGYSLGAHCSHCGQFGTVDDGSLICSRCNQRHDITPAEIEQRAADMRFPFPLQHKR